MQNDVTAVAVSALDATAMAAAQSRLDRLSKPPGSLGRLEELAIWLAGVTGNPQPSFPRKAVVVAAADHGVTAAGVSAYPSDVTAEMVRTYLRGGAAINVLARMQGATVLVVDAGVRTEPVRDGVPRPHRSIHRPADRRRHRRHASRSRDDPGPGAGGAAGGH